MRRLWLLAVLAVIVGSLVPGGSAPLHALSLLRVNDKMQHFVAYAVLACLSAWMASRPFALRTGLWLVALGALLEILQLLVPGRSCDWLDGLSDAAGVATGALFGECCAVLRASVSRTKTAPG